MAQAQSCGCGAFRLLLTGAGVDEEIISERGIKEAKHHNRRQCVLGAEDLFHFSVLMSLRVLYHGVFCWLDR